MAYALKPSKLNHSRGVATRPRVVALGHPLVLSHGIVLKDFTLEDPDLHAAGTEGRERSSNAVIDIGAQRMKRHGTFAIPFHARDFCAAQAPRGIETNTFGAKAQRLLPRALHRAAERNTALQLLGDRFGDQGRIEFRLADLD